MTRQPEMIDFPSPSPPDPDDAVLINRAHHVEVRPRTDAAGDALVVLDCVCGWAVEITDMIHGDDYITPWGIVVLTRRHYLALTSGHDTPARQVDHYDLRRDLPS